MANGKTEGGGRVAAGGGKLRGPTGGVGSGGVVGRCAVASVSVRADVSVKWRGVEVSQAWWAGRVSVAGTVSGGGGGAVSVW